MHGSKPEVSEILAYIAVDGSIPPAPLWFYILLFSSSTSYFPRAVILSGI